MSNFSAVKSADRALAILEHIAKHGNTSFSELSSALDLPKSSASALLGTLQAAGWLERDDRRNFAIGLRAWQVGRGYRGHDDLAERAKPLMDTLARDLDGTVQMARLDGMENVYIAISQSANPMRLASSVGMRLPSHATGIGKALLSQLDPEERARRIRNVTLERLTERTITDPERLLATLSESAIAGCAVDYEEYVEGCRCVAVPLHTAEVGVDTALSVTMPTFRTSADWPQDILPALRRTAAELRKELGLPERPLVDTTDPLGKDQGP